MEGKYVKSVTSFWNLALITCLLWTWYNLGKRENLRLKNYFFNVMMHA